MYQKWERKKEGTLPNCPEKPRLQGNQITAGGTDVYKGSIGWFTHPSDEGPSWNFREGHERWEDSLLGGPGVEGFELEFEFKCVLVFWTRFLVFWYFSELR